MTEAPDTATKGEIDARLAAETACRSQAEGLTREMEKRKDLYETLAQ